MEYKCICYDGIYKLIFPSLFRQTSMAKFLVQCGADIGKVTHRGYTAYDFATEMLDTEMMRIFVEAQVSVFNFLVVFISISPY